MGGLRASRRGRNRADGTDGNAGATARAGLGRQLRHERPATHRPKANGAGGTGVTAGLAINPLERQAGRPDGNGMIEAGGKPIGEHRLGTALRAGAAESAFRHGKIEKRHSIDKTDNAGRTVFDALPAARAVCKPAFRNPGRANTGDRGAPATAQKHPPGKDLLRHDRPSMTGRTRRAVEDLKHPDEETITADHTDSDDRPDAESKDKERNKLPSPSRYGLLRRQLFRGDLRQGTCPPIPFSAAILALPP